MPGQLLERPIVESFLMGLECNQVMRCQVIEPVGKRFCEWSRPSAQNHHVEKLLLDRKIFFEFDDERRIGEKIGQKKAEQSMPVNTIHGWRCQKFRGARSLQKK